ncbi:auxin response factor 16-like isoform X2 [Helianthus annuus]|uniref:auxin response factor 16-like isoform X2 n=1 Tax=Helianthus annuus TaxID=4232 RepID=UPI000B8FD553|nr:auxin response factor 16-like isoform X2 [Helianthus annuus]
MGCSDVPCPVRTVLTGFLGRTGRNITVGEAERSRVTIIELLQQSPEQDAASVLFSSTITNKRNSVKVSVELVVEAANLEFASQPFEVLYHPRTSTPEF